MNCTSGADSKKCWKFQNRLHYFRRMIAYEVISMRGNMAELPDFMIEVVPF